MDNSRLNALGWQPQVPLEISLDAAYLSGLSPPRGDIVISSKRFDG
jgi:hypothetical protein